MHRAALTPFDSHETYRLAQESDGGNGAFLPRTSRNSLKSVLHGPEKAASIAYRRIDATTSYCDTQSRRLSGTFCCRGAWITRY